MREDSAFIKIERSVRLQTVYEQSPAGKRCVSRPRIMRPIFIRKEQNWMGYTLFLLMMMKSALLIPLKSVFLLLNSN